MRTGLAVSLLLLGMLLPGARAQTAQPDPLHLIESIDYEGRVEHALVSAAELAERQQALRAEDTLYAQCLRQAMQAWQVDEQRRHKPFPRSAIVRAGVKSLGSFRDRAKAEEALGEARAKAQRKAAQAQPAPTEHALARTLFAQARRDVLAAQAEAAAQQRQQDVRRAAALGKALRLESLPPARVEYGMVENSPPEWNLAKGPGVLDQHQYGVMNKHWPGGTKIVPAIPPDFALDAGERYSSFMTNAFASGGAFLTGVGILLPINCCYHWIEYEIPPGAAKLSGSLHLADDVHGVSFHLDAEMANRFVFRIEIDGKQAFEHFMQRWSALDGSGQKLADFSVDVPAGAQRIRFYAEATCNDNNHNNELILHETVITF